MRLVRTYKNRQRQASLRRGVWARTMSTHKLTACETLLDERSNNTLHSDILS